MQDRDVADEDLRLVHALQVRPRASWSALARAIGSDPVTLARRWERLHRDGIAWIAAYRGDAATMALVEIECAPADTVALGERIAHDPEVLTVDLTTGNRDLLVTLNCADHTQLAGYVLERMSGLPMVRTLRTQIASSIAMDARHWRLRALDAGEVAALEAEPEFTATRRARLDPGIEERLLAVLHRNPRVTAAALAAELGTGKARAATLLSTVLRSGRIVLRTELARPYSEWPVYAWYFLTTDARERDETVARLASLREARLVASMIGTYDVALAVWLRSLDDVPRLETYLAERVAGVTVADRSVVLRTPFHLRQRIEPDGRLAAR